MQTALLVGLKSVDPTAYNGWSGTNGCWGCELDVDNINHILSPLGYDVEILKTEQATRKNMREGLISASKKLKAGDQFLFYYSGHGGQQPDLDSDEMDGQDETLVAYDGELIDDDLNDCWVKFRRGVRLVMISDSCNSGTNYRAIRDLEAPTPIIPLDDKAASEMKAEMIHLGGCRDAFPSAGYLSGGAFTQALCKVWNGGQFKGNYKAFLEAIRKEVGSGQVPQYNEYGPVSEEFRNEKPFTPGTRRDGTSVGAVKSVKCTLDVKGSHLREVKAAIHEEAEKCLLEALDDALSQRSGSASVSCTGSSGGGVSCTGTVTINF